MRLPSSKAAGAAVFGVAIVLTGATLLLEPRWAPSSTFQGSHALTAAASTALASNSIFVEPAAASSKPKKKAHKLCVLSRIHNQPRSLAEWLEYHAALGITRFYLVDDCSTDSGRTRTVMDMYQQEGLVKYYTTEDVTRRQCARVVDGREAQAERLLQRRRRKQCAGLHSEQQQQQQQQQQQDEVLGKKDQRLEQELYACSYKCSADEHQPDEKMLFQFMFNEATGGEACEWLMVFDTDEYMTFQTDLFATPDVPAYIADHEERTHGFPVLRFPWVMMGSGGHEARPPGLLADNFVEGYHPKWLLKTAAKAEFIQTWNFSHWPLVKDVPDTATARAQHGFTIPSPFGSLKNFTERSATDSAAEVRLKTSPVNATVDCVHPASGVFLKHYCLRSFEEFKAQRSDTKARPDGVMDVQLLINPKGAWERASTNPPLDDDPCSRTYSNEFTKWMADKTRANLAARRERWDDRHRQQSSSSTVGGEDDEFAGWIKASECGLGPRRYDGRFPPIEEWLL